MSPTSLTIGLAQFDISWENPETNFRKVENLLTTSNTMDLVVLPEMWSTGFSMSPSSSAETTPGPALTWMIEKARLLNLIICGSIAVEDQGLYYNRFYCVFPDGSTKQYDKRHLFSYGKEDHFYTPGDAHSVIDIAGWRIRPIICYDLRFPVWCRNTDGYDLLLVVANWPAVRIHHWDALLKARAIENQCYVAAVNRIGSDGNSLTYPGHSSIYDMNGIALMQLEDKERIEVYQLEKSALTSYRDQYRFLQDQDKFVI
ncbi:MAG: amidohydrolase [Saprospiraceae bacterium]